MSKKQRLRIMLETDVEVPHEVRGIEIVMVDKRLRTFNVGGVLLQPRFRHNFGEEYSRRRAKADLRVAKEGGDVNESAKVPTVGSTLCYLEESTPGGYVFHGRGAVMCSRTDQYSRPNGRARSLKRALIQVARHMAKARAEANELGIIEGREESGT